MGLKKRIILGSGVVIIGIILFVWKEYFLGALVTFSGILICLNVENTWDNKLLCYGLGIFCLIGGILFFFFPELASAPNSPLPLGSFSKPFYYTGGVIFTIVGIYMIFRGLKIDRKNSKDN